MKNNRKDNLIKIFKDGAITNNPTFVQLLGMCPTLATTTSALNALGMGLAATAVLVLSNVMISLLRKFIPKQVRIASYIVVISGAVTVIELLMRAYIPSLYSALGLYIPLIVVNCIILARAESFASKHSPLPSLVDGLGTGVGFTVALTLIGCVREVLGSGTLFGVTVTPSFYSPVTMLVMPSGAFLTLGVLLALVNKIKSQTENSRQKKKAAGVVDGEKEEDEDDE